MSFGGNHQRQGFLVPARNEQRKLAAAKGAGHPEHSHKGAAKGWVNPGS